MKALAIFTLILALFSSCRFLDYGFHRQRSRSDCFDRNEHQLKNPDFPTEDGPAKIDTLLYYSVVEFDRDYDWRRDTAGGAVNFSVNIYRNHELVQSMASQETESLSSDPDSHHIIGEHFYSERIWNNSTFLGKDSKTLFSFQGQEFMKGILAVGEDLYSLSQQCSGEGFSLRRNGQVIISRQDGIIFGDMGDPSYGESGALYMDEGAYCFCYYTENKGTYRYFQVKNGIEEEIGSDSILYQDLKINRGSCLHVGPVFYYPLEDARIWIKDESPYHIFAAKMSIGSAILYGTISPYGNIAGISKEEGTILVGDRLNYLVYENDAGDYVLVDSDRKERTYTQMSCISPSCISISGDKLALGLSPRITSGQAMIVMDGKFRTIPANGYISEVELIFSPPN